MPASSLFACTVWRRLEQLAQGMACRAPCAAWWPPDASTEPAVAARLAASSGRPLGADFHAEPYHSILLLHKVTQRGASARLSRSCCVGHDNSGEPHVAAWHTASSLNMP